MVERKDRDPDLTGPDDWMDRMQGDTDTRKVLRLWKGKRFLKRLRDFGADERRDEAGEGNGRTSWPRK